MIFRTLSTQLKALCGPFPVIFLTGPRQSGKTTLARETFTEFGYYSLENPRTREELHEDPRGFLSRCQSESGVIIDEAQHAPMLFSWLQQAVDERAIGPVILTGSQQFKMAEKITQSLAGRAAVLELLPFSFSELRERKPLMPDEFFEHGSLANREVDDVNLGQTLFTGFYPPIHDRKLNPSIWLNSYIATYIERDVRTLTNVGDLDLFFKFVRLCAGRAGQLLNMTALGSDAGVDQTTVKRWLSILRASYIVDLLQPHHANFNKRLVKSPKLYFNDTGLLCNLLGLTQASQLETHPLRGAIFENFIFAELKKMFLNQVQRTPLYFFRDRRGVEIDIVAEHGDQLLPVEIKSGQTVARDFLKNIDAYCKWSSSKGGMLVYGGDDTYVHKGHSICSWKAVV